MRQNLVVALLSVCCTLLAVNLYVEFQSSPMPEAHGQATGLPASQIAIATVQGTSNDPWCYVYDVAGQRLAVYRAGTQGLEFKGLRQITWDLKLEELNPRLASTGKVPVATIRKELELAGR